MTNDSPTLFDQLVDNGFRFIDRSVNSLEGDSDLSIVTFAAGLELLLKARLAAEHWSLVFDDPRNASRDKVSSGDFKSLSAKNICRRISSVSGDSLAFAEVEFENVFSFRNRTLHFLPHSNSDAVVAQQLRAWYQLKRLFDGRWKDLFSQFCGRIEQVERALLQNRKYLETRWRQQSQKIDELRGAGRTIACKVCEFDSAELSGIDKHALRAFSCLVCRSEGVAIHLECNEWVIAGFDSEEFECSCGETHQIDYVVNASDDRVGSPKDLIGDDFAYSCGECHRSRCVVPSDNGYVCLPCGEVYDDEWYLDSCGFCHEPWAGLDLDGSGAFGCEYCDGAIGWSK